jgi:hypothetical protein
MFISRGDAIRGLTGVQCGKRRGPRCGGGAHTPHRAFDASSQQYLKEEAGYGQADCSIMQVTRKLHGPASHWAPRELMPLVFGGTLATRI